jgi:hypothetical protein
MDQIPMSQAYSKPIYIDQIPQSRVKQVCLLIALVFGCKGIAKG